MADSTAILVLGMHRSGTSATAGWLHTLGVNLGPYLMAEDPTQPKGYFEHAEIVGIHDELMAALGSSWDDPRPLPEGWEHDRKIRFFRDRLVEIIRRDLMTEPLWCTKDPRLCRLLPMWIAMLGDLGVAARVICVLRHPAEVAESLALRNGFSAEKSGLLWLRYVLEAERHSRWTPRITLRYGDLLCDWRAESQRVAQAFGIVWPKPHDEAAAAATEFLEGGLRHHESVYFDRFAPPLRRWIVSAYRALKLGTDTSEDGQIILDSLHRELAPYDSYVAACWLERTRNMEIESKQARVALSQVQVQLGESRLAAAQARADSELAQGTLTQVRDELIHERSALARITAELAESQSDLATAGTERTEQIAALDAKLAKVQSELIDARAESLQVSADLAQAQADLAQARADMAQARRELAQARGELELNRADSQRAHQELDAVYRSRYWRFTRPWRGLDTYLRNRRRRRRERRRRSEALK
ncbi:MAG: hypothetical protein ACREPW_03100 [Candidatus Binataceae bacterium]